MYAKISDNEKILQAEASERLSDILFDIGQDQYKKSEHIEALFWLESSRHVLFQISAEEMGVNTAELKNSIMHSLARALLGTNEEDNRAKAWDIVREMELDNGERLPFTLLRLDLYASELTPAITHYVTTLERMSRTIHLTEANIKTVLSRFHQLRKWDSSIAQTTLVTFISERLMDSDQPDLLEKAFITAVWNGSTASKPENMISRLTDLLNQTVTSPNHVFSSAAVFSAQAILWKSIESCHQRQEYILEEGWCRLGLHKVFRGAGAENICKLQRRLMQCALKQASPARAREIYNDMTPIAQSEPASQFILYKIALRCGDQSLATECLGRICQTESKDFMLLFACILEAQETGEQTLTLKALQNLLEQYRHGLPAEVNVPALLRCTARMLIQRINQDEPVSHGVINDLCELLEGAVTSAQDLHKNLHKAKFTTTELDWFSRNAYNLALKNMSTWPESYTVRLIDASLGFIRLHPTDIEASIDEDLKLRASFCQYLAGSMHTSMARREDVLETQLQHYLSVRRAVQGFRTLAAQIIDSLDKDPKQDFKRKHLALSVFDFEAAARLKSWENLPAIIQVVMVTTQQFETQQLIVSHVGLSEVR